MLAVSMIKPILLAQNLERVLAAQEQNLSVDSHSVVEVPLESRVATAQHARMAILDREGRVIDHDVWVASGLHARGAGGVGGAGEVELHEGGGAAGAAARAWAAQRAGRRSAAA